MNGNKQAHEDVYGTKLTNELKLLEDFWQKCLRATWNPDSFALLKRLAHRIVHTTQFHTDTRLTGLASHLERLLNGCLSARRMPCEDEQRQFKSLLEGMRMILSGTNAAVEDFSHTGPKSGAEPVLIPGASSTVKTAVKRIVIERTSEVYIVDTREAKQLAAGLDEAGFQVRQFRELTLAEAALDQVIPLAVIVHVGFPDGRLDGIEMVNRLRGRVELTAPIFFTAQQDDFEARLAAVQAGGAGFFVEPLDIEALQEKLETQLSVEPEHSCHRLLIVDDKPAEAQAVADVLEARGFVTQVVTQPSRVIHNLQDFQPDLVVLDLELKDVPGQELLAVLRQHDACQALPMVLLTEPTNLLDHLPHVDRGADDLLSKPVIPDYLGWLVRRRLSQARAMRNRLNALSQKDASSGLYSRQYFLSELERTLLNPGAENVPVAVMLVLLENWRVVRDETDVVVADELVWRIARRLQRVLGTQHRLARFGDAIFSALIEGADRETLLFVARAVRQALEKCTYKVGRYAVRIHTCIGISIADDTNHDPLRLIQWADLACSLAREAEGKRVHIYDSEIDRKFDESRQQYLLEQISDAMLYERMHLLFQPIVSLQRDKEERYEVFLRLHDQEGQELLPETVFNVVKQHSLGARLDGWVISRSIALLSAQRNRTRAKTLFINLSPAALHSKALRAWVRERIEKTQVDPQRLVFEVSEDVARQYFTDLAGFMEDLGDLGCSFSLEHFGRRADSLRLLEQLPVHYVKLDSHFVQDLKGNRGNYVKQRLKEFVEKLDEMGVVIIVVGIEELSPLPVLWSCGVDCVQGFFLQRPHEEMSYDFSGDRF